MTQQRQSSIELVREWPEAFFGYVLKPVMKRKWGYRHDEIWYAVDVEEVVEELRKLPHHAQKDRGVLHYLMDPTNKHGITWWEWTWPDGRYRRYECRDGVWRRLYLRRRVIYFKIPWTDQHWTLRWHTFYSGDDDSPHDHPWWFVTFPLASYKEVVLEPKMLWDDDWEGKLTTKGEFRKLAQVVRAFRFHYRPATYRHAVIDPPRPVHTLVLSGPRERKFGFWPEPDTFVPYDQWGVTYQKERRDVRQG